ESNLNEGRAVVAAYNLLGYDGMALGNHDFDYGRAALLARAADARYPFLSANVIDEKTGRPLIAASALVEVAGVKVGIVGASTTDAPTSTMAANFRGLRLEPLAPAIAAEARALRARGAQVVVLVSHAGLCSHTVDDDEIRTCTDGELAAVIPALGGSVDAVI